MARILRIGKEPEKNITNYQPLVFHPTSKHEFFPELFSRTMWLLSKTRREMQVSSYEDFDKVMRILSKQIRMVFQEKPKEYTTLLELMKKINYKRVAHEIEVSLVKIDKNSI